MRLKQNLPALEWQVSRGVWRKLDLAPVTKFMKSIDDHKLAPGEYGDDLKLVDIYAGRSLEIQVVSARFLDGDLNQLGSLRFTTLVERARPLK